jgi:uncharacterized protein involved in outer membrane biogenesis
VVPRLDLALELMPLLHGEMVIPRVALHQPSLALLADDQGRANYSFDFGGGGGEPPKIGHLDIEDGQAKVAIARLRADFQARFGTEGDHVVVSAEGRYADQPITARFTGGALLSLRDEQNPWPVQLDLANGPTRLHLEGTIARPLHFAGADLKLDLAGPDMKLLTPLTGVPLASTPNYRITGKLDYAEGSYRFTDMQGRVGNSDLGGEISIVPGRERPLVTANLHSQRLDLADLGGFVGTQPGRRDTQGQTPAHREAVAQAESSPTLLPRTPVNLPKLNAADVRLSLRAQHIQDERVPLDNLVLGAAIENGAVRIDPLRFGVGRGSIGGKLALTPQAGDRLALRGDFELRRVDVSRLLQPMGVRGGGTLGGIANLDGTGRSLGEILGTGNGALTLAMVGGNLSALVVDLAGLQFGRALLSALGVPERTSIRCMVADLALRQGVLNTQTFVLDTDNSVIHGAGTVNLGQEALDLRLRAESKSVSVGSLPTTIDIGGHLKDPSITPEIGELAARGGAAIGLGILFPPLALLPTIQLGVGEDRQCEGLVAASQRRGR